VGRSVGRGVLQSYANAFGFNKPFYFDLPVTTSVAHLPETPVKLGEAAAGLNKQFLVSPLHVASIVSTVLNRGRMMKPYLVDYVLHRNKVVYRRKPFPLSQPISSGVALQIYEMMRTTTTHGTAKNGFAGHTECPNLADLCGGKTGTLTGVEPHLLFTWFGGFTRAAGRDLSITFLCGQQGRSRVKATTLAAKASLELLNRIPAAPAKVASR
jgi:cell division protein FtsI/penicillin-binding protein 2